MCPRCLWSPGCPVCLLDASWVPPGCLLGGTGVPPRCLPDASQMLPRCLPDDPQVLCERSRGISCISIHRILFRICLDKSGLSIGTCRGHFLLPSWKNRCQVRNDTKSRKNKVLRMAYSMVENVPTPSESIFKLCPASQLPHTAKSEEQTTKTANTPTIN